MMGGGGHSPAPHPSQPKQAFLFNEGPGPRKVEMWEPITSTVYWSAFLILVVGLYNAPETRIQEWAAEEAEARLARIEEGKDVEYGHIYHKQLLTGGFVQHSAANADSPPEAEEEEEEEEN
ncbi:hypothetical protein NSK_000601 [Nannochloropsis salina CCMP1776]|uniref:NADH dehydrogenase [ubiquinone] 1 beta subcomplex subunit 11, mitochondrial n=1 Tax=Nannochloropsis salina CCMP1776 TaxID=1027361 RepID=A0A4D9D9H2_9STRA|nr:hypothetical protein NSK_000601 [Nannochloropsis salina CCMP1776]|eukprot:TFJ88252.1 hypothetical protein NSK_000601 [Nannochloropsis salina CCMP1776]